MSDLTPRHAPERWHPKRVRTKAALLFACCLWPAAVAIECRAQTQQFDDSVRQLKEQISSMWAVAESPGTSPEVRALNHTFMEERKARLRSILRQKIETLRGYGSAFGSSLNPGEKERVENSIRELEGELMRLDEGATGAATADAVLARRGTVAAPSTAAPASAPPGTTQTTGPAGTLSAPAAPSPSAPALGVAASAPAAAQTLSCFPDATQPLLDFARGTAQAIVDRNDAGRFTEFAGELVLLAVADALTATPDAEALRGRAILRQLKVTQFKEETRRTDEQVGASARSEGTTSAVEKPDFAKLLGFAVEHGAIQQEVNGTTLTLSTSPYALIAAAQGDESTTYKRYAFFNRLGIAANFNIDNQDAVLANARRSQLSEWSAKLRLSDDRTTRSEAFEAFWRRDIAPLIVRRANVLSGGLANTFLDETESVRRAVGERFFSTAPATAGAGFIKNALDASAGRTREERIALLQTEIVCRLKEVVVDRIDTFRISAETRERILRVTIPGLQEAEVSEARAVELVEREIERLRGLPVYTFAYTNKREATGSDYSVLKFLYEKSTFSPMKMLANAGVSFYHHPNQAQNQKTLRDFAVAFS
ncbi:MAG TPA: hypothetical protein VGV38_17525, partial [Pyrinomonadaceae bacterium]|nr:hypothetical protein [Pyrinomonadaceae bacterium]